MDSFKLSKTHNMLALMLDPQFKDLNLMGNYVGHAFAIEIVSAYDTQFLLPTLKASFQKLHGWSNAFSSVVHKTMCINNAIFGIGVYEDETSFEQVSLFLIF